MWTAALLKSKTKAWLIHLGISALIFLPFLYLIWARWFPPPMFFTDGGWQGLRIMLLVDLAIGPSLTLLVFNPAKSRGAITFDFCCIALVQTVALIYGYVSVESKRIQTVVFDGGVFQAVPKDAYGSQEISPADWQALGDRPPYWVYVREFRFGEEKAAARVWEITEGVPRHELQMLYRPLLEAWNQPATAKKLAVAALSADADFAALCGARAEIADGELCIGLRGYFAPAVLIFDKAGQRRGYRVGQPYNSLN